MNVGTSWISQGASASLTLSSVSPPVPLPTLNLANLSLSTLPFDVRTLEYQNYGAPYHPGTSGVPSLSLFVQADPLSAAPEPSSLTLLVLGGLGLVAGRRGPLRGRK